MTLLQLLRGKGIGEYPIIPRSSQRKKRSESWRLPRPAESNKTMPKGVQLQEGCSICTYESNKRASPSVWGYNT